MADTSERIIILSAVVLVIIVLLPNSGLTRTIGTVFDVEVEITTSRDNYTIGEGFTATVYFVNSGSKDVWMNPIGEVAFLGRSVNDPEPNAGYIVLDWPHAQLIHIPPKSKISFFERGFVSQYSGDFLITCFGAEKTVLILDSEFKGDPIQAKMNKHSYNNSEKASLKITNNTPDTITLGEYYEMQKKKGDSWIKVPEALYHPNIWLLYADIVDSGESLSQQISIEMLEAGQYRISKEVHSDTPREHIDTLIVEFEIQGLVNAKYDISVEEAVDIAVKGADPKGWVDIDAKIQYLDKLMDGTSIEKHVWIVSLYNTPRKANSGSVLRVIIDPHNGTVFESETIEWISTP